jgi:hypothetical protein
MADPQDTSSKDRNPVHTLLESACARPALRAGSPPPEIGRASMEGRGAPANQAIRAASCGVFHCRCVASNSPVARNHGVTP